MATDVYGIETEPVRMLKDYSFSLVTNVLPGRSS